MFLAKGKNIQMKHSTYRTICNMTNTLLEAAGMLLNSNNENEKQQLLRGVNEFAKTIEAYIETAGAECKELGNVIKGISRSLQQGIFEIGKYIVLFEQVDSSLNNIYETNFSLEYLKEETNFIRYISLLQWATEKYCILVASSDTPCGSRFFTHSVAQELCKIGIKTDLSDKFRASYAAIIDRNRTVAEKISFTESVVLEETLGDIQISIKSAGMNVRDSSNSVYVDISKGNEKLLNPMSDMPNFVRGLLFVVFDKQENMVCDIVGFDTYAPYLPCIRKENKLIKMIEETNPGVTFIRLPLPNFSTEYYTENEKYILDNNIDYSLLLVKPWIKSEIQNYIKDAEGVKEVLTPPASYVGVDGARRYEDHAGRYLNTANGHRKTMYQPDKPQRTIYMFGGCGISGIGVRDEGTCASALQLLLNEFAAEKGFVVENYGFPLEGTDALKEELAIFNSLPLKSGDIVLGLGNENYNIDRNYLKDRYKYGDIFFDKKHLTEAGYKLVAEGVFLALQENNFFEESLYKEQPDKKKDTCKYCLTDEQLQELNSYKQTLSELWETDLERAENIGAIVMNCNPFTLGHRYLIQEAAKNCEKLIIFVVQEDKSFFPYDDRIELVRQGVRDLQNVFVVGSGNFIISSLTFRSYFNKASLQDRQIDCTDDVTLFVNEIAPAAHIKKRFVGEEPLDNVTNQYNRTLEKILPMYGIEFVEIERVKSGDNVISASKVRQLLEEKQWKELQCFVPQSTLHYLEERFR